MARTAGGIVAGLVAALSVILLVAWIGHLALPGTGEFDLESEGALASVPLSAKLVVLFAWFSGALAGGATALRLTGREWALWIVAAAVVAVGVGNIFVIPYPVWMQIGAFAAPLLGGLVARHLPIARNSGRPDAGL